MIFISSTGKLSLFNLSMKPSCQNTVEVLDDAKKHESNGFLPWRFLYEGPCIEADVERHIFFASQIAPVREFCSRVKNFSLGISYKLQHAQMFKEREECMKFRGNFEIPEVFKIRRK